MRITHVVLALCLVTLLTVFFVLNRIASDLFPKSDTNIDTAECTAIYAKAKACIDADFKKQNQLKYKLP